VIQFDLAGTAVVCDDPIVGGESSCVEAPVSVDATAVYDLVSGLAVTYVQTDDSADLGLVREVPGNIAPSEDCDPGQRVIDSTTQGVHSKLYVHQPSPDQVWVCTRVKDASGEGYGGKLVITPSGLDPDVIPPGMPTTDAAASACTTTTTPPNQVPGTHPLSYGGVGPVDYLVDAYANGSEAWLCLQVGLNDTRVKVPLGNPTPGASFGYAVTWYPDEGTP
jgi:hypothetical protein